MGQKATAYKFDTCTLIGVHSTMHLVDPIRVHVSYTCTLCKHAKCVCVGLGVYMYTVCVCVCMPGCVHVHCVCVCVATHCETAGGLESSLLGRCSSSNHVVLASGLDGGCGWVWVCVCVCVCVYVLRMCVQVHVHVRYVYMHSV